MRADQCADMLRDELCSSTQCCADLARPPSDLCDPSRSTVTRSVDGVQQQADFRTTVCPSSCATCLGEQPGPFGAALVAADMPCWALPYLKPQIERTAPLGPQKFIRSGKAPWCASIAHHNTRGKAGRIVSMTVSGPAAPMLPCDIPASLIAPSPSQPQSKHVTTRAAAAACFLPKPFTPEYSPRLCHVPGY